MKSSFPAWAAGVATATFIAFLPALGAGFVSFDDGVNFLRNPYYRGFSAENLAWMFSDVKYRAAVRRHRGDLDGAIADYETVLKADAGDVDASLALAAALEARARRAGAQAGQPDLRAARERYERIYEMAPPGPARQEATRGLERLKVSR